MSLEAGLIAMCGIASLGAIGLVAFALWIRSRDEGGLGNLRTALQRRMRVVVREYAKTAVNFVACGLLFWALAPDYPILAVIATTVLSIAIALLSTGAVQMTFKRDGDGT